MGNDLVNRSTLSGIYFSMEIFLKENNFICDIKGPY